MTTKLRYKAVAGSLLADPQAPGAFLGRKALPMPPDGWEGEQAKSAEARHPIDDKGAEVTRDQRARWAVVVDALRKGVDLEPADEETRKFIGPTRVERRKAIVEAGDDRHRQPRAADRGVPRDAAPATPTEAHTLDEARRDVPVRETVHEADMRAAKVRNKREG